MVRNKSEIFQFGRKKEKSGFQRNDSGKNLTIEDNNRKRWSEYFRNETNINRVKINMI